MRVDGELMYGAEACGMRVQKRHMLYVRVIMCLWTMYGVNRVSRKEVRCRVNVRKL